MNEIVCRPLQFMETIVEQFLSNKKICQVTYENLHVTWCSGMLWNSAKAKNTKIAKFLSNFLIAHAHRDRETHKHIIDLNQFNKYQNIIFGWHRSCKTLSDIYTQFSWHATFYGGQSPENVPNDKIKRQACGLIKYWNNKKYNNRFFFWFQRKKPNWMDEFH